MSHTNTLFSKILRLIDRREFDRIVKAHKGDFRSRSLHCWDQLTLMLFAQIKQSPSGRAALSCFNSHEDKLYHIGSNAIAKSTLNDANAKRNPEIFEKLFYSLIQKYQSEFDSSQLKEMVTAIDSTSILLPPSLQSQFLDQNKKAALKIHTVYCLDQAIPTEAFISSARINDIVFAKDKLSLIPGRTYVFDRGYYDFGWWFKINQTGSFFVTRLKRHTKPTFIKEYSHPHEKNILSDHVVQFTSRMKGSRKNPYQGRLRRVIAKDDAGKEIQLITNDFDSKAQEIADIYRSRWQIELFFKWIKQNLKIKTFYGRSPNAIKTQIYIAMIAYLLLKMAHSRFMVGRALQEFVKIASEQLMSRYAEWWRPFILPTRRRKRRLEEAIPTLFDLDALYS